MAAMPVFPTKITTKECGLTPKFCTQVAETLAEDGPVPALRIMGAACSAVGKQSDIGPYTLFEGEFEAVNLSTKQVFRSKALILPPVAETLLEADLDTAKGKSKEGEAVWAEFALDITIGQNTSKLGGSKYKYGVIALIEPASSPMLSNILKKIGPPPVMKALPAKK